MELGQIQWDFRPRWSHSAKDMSKADFVSSKVQKEMRHLVEGFALKTTNDFKEVTPLAFAQ